MRSFRKCRPVLSLKRHSQHLDTGDDFPYSHETKDRSVSIAFGDTLVLLLNSLPEFIVPRDLHGRCLAAASRDDAFEVR